MVAAPPRPLAAFFAKRGYLPLGVPLIKHVLALPGQSVCRDASLITVDGKAVGMVNFIHHRSNWSIGNACYLQDLYVDSGQRGLGIGRQLIEHVYAQAKTDNCIKVYWVTHETNATAISLYQQVAERSGFIQFRKEF